jgi:hypothetical protein
LRYSSFRLILATTLLAVPISLFGSDGVILIDQNAAMNGNVTPGDTPGFPVTISQTGSYRLAGNLVVPNADTTAVQITAEAVTLDLNGFSIIGPGGCTDPAATCPAPGQGVGIRAGGEDKFSPRGVRVFNGSVRGMGSIGIILTGDGSSVEKVSAQSNAGGGMTVAGSVIQSSATQNGSFGIIGNLVRDSTAVENLGDGILLDAGGVATGNVSSSNGGFGIFAPYSTAKGNTAFVNKSFGISAFCPSAIVGNTIVTTDAGGGIDTQGMGCVVNDNGVSSVALKSALRRGTQPSVTVR